MNLEQLAALPCRTCGGEKGIYSTERQRGHYEPIPCPDCRDAKGQPTGRLLTGLTVECQYCGFKGHCPVCTHIAENCKDCHGTGRVLVSEEAATKWLLEWCRNNGWQATQYVKTGWMLQHVKTGFELLQPTLVAAVASALEVQA